MNGIYFKSISTALGLALSMQVALAGVDLDMQYTYETNALSSPNSSNYVELQSVERFITGGGLLSEKPNSASDWTLMLHEKLASKYSFLSTIELSSSLNYHWQSSLGFTKPWRSAGVEVAAKSARISDYNELRAKAYITESRYLTDNLMVQSYLDFEYANRKNSDLSGSLFTTKIIADYSLNQSISIYSRLQASAGKHVVTYNNNSDYYSRFDNRDSLNIPTLNTYFDGEWYAGAAFGGETSALIGVNFGIEGKFALDLTHETSMNHSEEMNSMQSKTKISMFLAY